MAGTTIGIEKKTIGRTRSGRLEDACARALERLRAKEESSIDPDIFAELGEVLFWLVALTKENTKEKKKDTTPLLMGLTWARDRITHGVLMTAPTEWHYGSELGRWVLGRGVLGTVSGHKWIERDKVALGPSESDWKDPNKEAAYDAEVSGKRVVDLLQRALAEAR